MLLAILAACTAPLVFDAQAPLFKFTGPPCPPHRQWLDCACSEGMTWDATPRAEWYEIRRVHSSGTVNQVGVTTGTRWWFRNDFPFPRAGEFYEYFVRACNRKPNGVAQCSPQWSRAGRYKAARYACFKAGVEVPCYPGDPVGD